MEKNDISMRKKLQIIRFNMSEAKLEDIKDILEYYVKTDGGNDIDPLVAASLNARYHELTGEDFPGFIDKQIKALNEIIRLREGIRINGKPDIYQRLLNNLTGKGIGISILTGKSHISRFDKIKYGISTASAEDVEEVLNYCDQESFLINGVQVFFRPSVLMIFSLNARYKELKGEDHPTFLKVRKQLLREIKGNVVFDGNGGIKKQLKNNTILIGNGNHIIKRTDEILENPQEASLEDISALLDIYNGPPILINGVLNYPFNDPISADKLNARFSELTGHDHQTFLTQVPRVINNIVKEKNRLMKKGIFGKKYFDTLEQIMKRVEQGRNSNLPAKKTRSPFFLEKIHSIFSKKEDIADKKDKGLQGGTRKRNFMELKPEVKRKIQIEAAEAGKKFGHGGNEMNLNRRSLFPPGR